jgi:hypothetical protein
LPKKIPDAAEFAAIDNTTPARSAKARLDPILTTDAPPNAQSTMVHFKNAPSKGRMSERKCLQHTTEAALNVCRAATQIAKRVALPLRF